MKIISCKSWYSRMTGLMFRFRRDKALVFFFPNERLVSLHMFFVFYPIDVAWLDSARRIVELKENFMPFAVHIPRHKAKYVLELPSGYISRTNLKTGEIFSHFEI